MDLKSILFAAGVHFCDTFSLISGWVCRWKPFWIRSATRFRRLSWRNGHTWVMTPQVTSESSAWRIILRWYMMLNTKSVPPNKNDLKMHLRHRDRHGRQVENMCQQLCAHVGSVGFVCLRHLSCVPSCRGFSHTVSFCQVFTCTRVCLPQGPLSLCLHNFFL